MRFAFDQRSPRQRRAGTLLLAGVPLGALLFWMLLDVLPPLVGGWWSVLLAIIIVTSPLVALYRVAGAGRTARQAAADGVLAAIAVALLYGWVFTAPFISPPGY